MVVQLVERSSTVDYRPILATWANAIEKFKSDLSPEERKKIRLDACPHASFNDLYWSAKHASAKANAERPLWTDNFQRICQKINRYAIAGDLIMQYQAEYTSLLWGAIRFLFLFVVEEGAAAAKLSDALDSSILQVVFRAEEYAKLFTTHSGSSTERVFLSLQENLTALFAEVLSFLIKASTFFEKPILKRIFSAGFSTFDTMYKPMLDRILQCEGDVEKNIRLLNQESDIQRQECENVLWLKHADFSVDIDRLRRDHLPGTCDWFLQRNKKYLSWCKPRDDHPSTLLWIYGKPGCGKSTLAAQIDHNLRCVTTDLVFTVFCKDGAENKSDVESILRNMVYQILHQGSGSKRLHQIVQVARLEAKTPYAQSMDHLWTILQQMLLVGVQVSCIIDGFDECSDYSREQMAFLDQLAEVSHDNPKSLRVAILSRMERPVTQRSTWWDIVQIRTADVEGDIEHFVTTKVQASKLLSKHKQKEQLCRVIQSKSEGMVLYVTLMLKTLEEQHWNVDHVLDHPPRGLESLYTTILERLIKRKEVSDLQVRHPLLLVMGASRPLNLKELALGVALLDGLSCEEDYLVRGDPASEGEAIMQRCNPFLMLMPDQTVQLVHTSLRQYLLGPSAVPNFTFNLPDVNRAIALNLLVYLSFDCFNNASPVDSEVGHSGALGVMPGGKAAELFGDMNSEEPTKFFANGPLEKGRNSPSEENGYRLSQALREYATLHLVDHCLQTLSADVAEKLLEFFHSVPGWNWLDRLANEHHMSHGHLLLIQSEIKAWAPTTGISLEIQSKLSNFLTTIFQQKCEHATRNFEPEHESALTAQLDLSRIYRRNSLTEEAATLQVKVLRIAQDRLGEEHKITLETLKQLGTTYLNQGHWGKAEELQTRVVVTTESLLGRDHPDTLTAMTNLALTYNQRGRFSEAEQLCNEAFKLSKEVRGIEHPETVYRMGILSEIYKEQGRWKESEKLAVERVEISRRTLGDEHPSTLAAMGSVGHLYTQQARPVKAEPYQDHVLAKSRKLYGPDHPRTLTALNNLGRTYRDQKRFEEAQEIARQVLDRRTAVLGKNHPDTIWALQNLALSFSRQGQYEAGEKLQLESLTSLRQTLGNDHRRTLVAMRQMSDVHQHLGRWMEAESLCVEAVESGKRILGEEHPDTLKAMVILAEIWEGMDKHDESTAMRRRALQFMPQSLGDDHPLTLKVLEAVGPLPFPLVYDDESCDPLDEEMSSRLLRSPDSGIGIGATIHPLLGNDERAQQRGLQPLEVTTWLMLS